MTGPAILPPCAARALPAPYYDRWLSEGGETIVTFHRKPGGFIARFVDICDFEIESADLSVSCVPNHEAETETIEDLYLNQVVPLILGHTGELVLHGSGVVTPAGAVGFVGMSGRGKSTLAAAFARAGYPFVTDDGLMLTPDAGGYMVRPNNARFRLRADSDEALFGARGGPTIAGDGNKRRIAAGEAVPFQDVPARLRAIYLLGDGSSESIAIAALNPSNALASLISHSFILDVEDRGRMRGHFERLAGLATSQPCFTLDFPRRYGYLPQVMADVLAHAGSGDF